MSTRSTLALLALAVLVTSCQSPVVQVPDGPPIPIDSIALADDRRSLTVRFIGGPAPGTRPTWCTVEYTASADSDGHALVLGVFELWNVSPPPGGACEAMGYRRSLPIELEQPFTGAEWRDLAGYRHFLQAPEDLAEITLPPGWTLIGEADVAGSLTGRWQRTYKPEAGGPREQTLVVYQAFDGPVNVTGGEETITVDVAGRSGTLYRHRPTGELVLTWSLEGNGLALVAYEAFISVEQLIEIAESARTAHDA